MAEVFRRCGCRDEDGRQYGARCPRLADPKHGSWGFRVSNGFDPITGKRRQVVRSNPAWTERQAKAERARIVVSIADHTHRDDMSMTVEVYLREWLATKITRGLKATTARDYSRHIELDLSPTLGRLRLRDLQPSHVEAVIDGMLRAGRGATTIHRVISTLRSALSSAKRARLVIINAAVDVELPRRDRHKVRPWNAAELALFLEHAGQARLGVMYEFMVMTGLRRGEIAGLRWMDVDLERGLLRVTLNRVQAGRELVEQTTKSAESERTLELSDRAVGLLLEWHIRQESERAEWGSAYTASGFFWTYEDGRPLLPGYVSATFKRLQGRAGIRVLRLHDLRHQNASLMLSNGVDIAIVSKLLGHSTLAVTSEIYGHLLPGAGKAAAEIASAQLPTQKAPANTLQSHPLKAGRRR